jgi:hypothetical protein
LINHFSFIENTSIAARWKVQFSLSNALKNTIDLHISGFVPTLSMAAPAHPIAVECTITLAGCRVTDAQPTGNHTVQLTIPYHDTPVDAQVISFTAPRKWKIWLLLQLLCFSSYVMYKKICGLFFCLPLCLVRCVYNNGILFF